MAKSPSNPPLFEPTLTYLGERSGPTETIETTITLRDLFAGLAMMGYAVRQPAYDYEDVAVWAYRQADAMLASREK